MFQKAANALVELAVDKQPSFWAHSSFWSPTKDHGR